MAMAAVQTILLLLLLSAVFLATVPERSSGEFEQWCVADVQTPDDHLQFAMNWACGADGGANCSMIQENQPCYLPNTVASHASYAFNSYYQKFKSVGASCSFNGAAISTEDDPSYGSCHYVYTT